MTFQKQLPAAPRSSSRFLPCQVEVTNDIAFLMPVMVAIMVAKWIGDLLTPPLYHAIIALKCLPFLEDEPEVHDEEGRA